MITGARVGATKSAGMIIALEGDTEIFHVQLAKTAFNKSLLGEVFWREDGATPHAELR